MNELVISIPPMFSVEEASRFREEVREHIQNGQVRFMLDFSGCSFIDSTGLGVIVSSYKKCVEQGGSIRLKAMNANVFKIFELTRLNNVFEILS